MVSNVNREGAHTMSLTHEQKQKLQTAIDSAIGHGTCRYTLYNKPACVIAQLAHLEGVSYETLESLTKNGKSTGKTIGYILDAAESGSDDYQPYNIMHQALKSYPKDLLSKLQICWDNPTICWDNPTVSSADEARKQMVELVQLF